MFLIAVLVVGAYYALATGDPLFLSSPPGAGSSQSDLSEAAIRAVALMERGIDVVAAARVQAGFPIDRRSDPNETGLIGLEWSSTTTTLGDLASKRTATNPRWAGVITEWMHEAGVGPGDVVWAAFSGSFPGLNLAVLAAAEAVEAELIAVTSLAASTWGANVPGFPWSEMERALKDAGLVSGGSVALTLGGDDDRGPGMLDLFGDGESSLRDAAARSGLPLIESDSLAAAVQARLHVFTAASDERRPKLFINVGGGHASLGNCSDAPLWPSGLTREARRCSGDPPGLLYEMAERGVPVLHLLNIKPLALRVGIPVDGKFR